MKVTHLGLDDKGPVPMAKKEAVAKLMAEARRQGLVLHEKRIAKPPGAAECTWIGRIRRISYYFPETDSYYVRYDGLFRPKVA